MNALKKATFWESIRKWFVGLVLTYIGWVMTQASIKMGDFIVKTYKFQDQQEAKDDSLKKIVVASAKLLTEFAKQDSFEKGIIHQELLAHQNGIELNQKQITSLADAIASINNTITFMQRNRKYGTE